MGRNLKITLTPAQRLELENNYRAGSSHAFRQRCRMILLKSDGSATKNIVSVVGIKSENEINKWVKRYLADYKESGIDVLHNKSGQGRKAVFNVEKDKAKVKKAIGEERQRLSQAKELIEKDHDKPFHLKTLKRFLKLLAVPTNVSANT